MEHIDERVLGHLHLVDYFARRYTRVREHLAWLEHEDVWQAGALGLIRAARKYEPERGAPFHAYARTWIRGEIIATLYPTTQSLRHSKNLELFKRMLRFEAAPRLLWDLPSQAEEEREDLEWLRQALRKLDLRTRKVLSLRARGVSVKAIAKRLGLSQSQVWAAKHFGLKRLRSMAPK